MSHPIGHTRSQEGQRSHDPHISSISRYFVLREDVSHTKHCCSVKVENIWPLPKFWAGYATSIGSLQN